MSVGEALRNRWSLAVMWVGVAVLGGTLLLRRYEAALGPGNAYDLRHCFLPAARAVSSSGDPYAVGCYVYPPLLAEALAGVADVPGVVTWWTLAGLGLVVVSVVVTALALRGWLAAWRAPLFTAGALVTLLWTWPLTREFHIGGTNLILLVVLTIAARLAGRPGVGGALVAVAGLLKTWPAAIGLWLVRRSAPAPRRALLVGVAVGATGLVLGFLPLVPGSVGEWLRSSGRLAVQPHPSYSASGLGVELFGDGALGTPLVDSSVLRWTVTALVAGLVVGLLCVVLLRPGDPWIALWHVTGCVLLLMPTSHIVYLILLVPILWYHGAVVLRGPPARAEVVAAAGALAWWVVAMRPWSPDTLAGFTATVLATLALLALSVTVVARSAGEERNGHLGPAVSQVG